MSQDSECDCSIPIVKSPAEMWIVDPEEEDDDKIELRNITNEQWQDSEQDILKKPDSSGCSFTFISLSAESTNNSEFGSQFKVGDAYMTAKFKAQWAEELKIRSKNTNYIRWNIENLRCYRNHPPMFWSSLAWK